MGCTELKTIHMPWEWEWDGSSDRYATRVKWSGPFQFHITTLHSRTLYTHNRSRSRGATGRAIGRPIANGPTTIGSSTRPSDHESDNDASAEVKNHQATAKVWSRRVQARKFTKDIACISIMFDVWQ